MHILQADLARHPSGLFARGQREPCAWSSCTSTLTSAPESAPSVIWSPVTAFTVPIALACELADTCGALSDCRQLAPASPADTLIPMPKTSAKTGFLLKCILGYSTFPPGQDRLQTSRFSGCRLEKCSRRVTLSRIARKERKPAVSFSYRSPGLSDFRPEAGNATLVKSA